jgi:hypothetical protein
MELASSWEAQYKNIFISCGKDSTDFLLIILCPVLPHPIRRNERRIRK